MDIGIIEKILIFILIIILVILGVLITRASKKKPFTIFGGAPCAHCGHFLGNALHETRKRQAETALPNLPPSNFAKRVSPIREITHGGAGKKPKKQWTACKTWDEVFQDDDMRQSYWDDVNHVLNELGLNWDSVLAELGEKLYDDREWAGRINVVDGVPKIVELVPSPYAAGEGPLPAQAVAMVPSEIVEALEKKPAFFIFHTHPKEAPGSAFPSPTDVVGSMMIAYTGHFIADLMISPYGVFMYGPNYDFRLAIRKCKTAEDAKLTLYRRNADIIAALEGARSWTTPWKLETYIHMAEQYDVEYISFPTYKYAKADRRSLYTMPPVIDHDHLHDYHSRIKELEEEAKNQKVVALDSSKHRGRIKQVRFAEPLVPTDERTRD